MLGEGMSWHPDLTRELGGGWFISAEFPHMLSLTA